MALKTYTNLVLRIADLIEAEGRSLRSAVRTEIASIGHLGGVIAVSFGLAATAIPLLVAGLGLVLLSFFLWLRPMVGLPAASLASGIVALALGAGLLAVCRRNKA